MTEQRTHPTLLHRLVALPSTQRKAAVFRFLNEDGQPAVERSLESLMERALRVGGHLLERANLVAGDRVVLVYLPSLDFVEALLGCLMVGVIPAAILPPDPMGGDVERLQRVVDNAQAKALLTHRAFHRARMFGRLSTMTRLRPRAAWPVLPWIVTDAASRAPRAALRFPPGDELALLQYTSGSTGTPKGVRVTHANLAHNVEFITRVGAYHAHSHLLWWVPQYHDFGLVAGIFAALWRGCSLSLLSPFSFLRRPAVWPEALGRLRATHTTSPNFGLELLLRKSSPEQRATWDLSALERLGMGGEPIIGDTVLRFEQALAEAGLRPGVLVGAYGLAEHVAAISVSGTGRITVDPVVLRAEGRLQPSSGPQALNLVSSGSFAEYVRVRVVDPERGEVLPEGSIGEIWASSPSVVDGYEGEPSPPDFAARLREDDGHRYLRTGDLGTMLNGQLWVTGRIKELIIIRGQNVHPTDLEHAAHHAHPAVRPGRVAAFGAVSELGTEQVVVMAELRDGTPPETWPAIAAAIRSTLSAGVPAGAGGVVVLVREGLVTRTTSGKVQRGACKLRYEQPGFAKRSEVLLVDAVSPVTTTPPSSANACQEVVSAALSSALGRPITPEVLQRSPAELGLDSMQVTELQAILELRLGSPIPLEELLAAPTVGALAECLAERGGDAAQQLGLFLRRYRPADAAPTVQPPALRRITTPEEAPEDATGLLWAPDPSTELLELIEQARCLARRHPRAELRVLTRGAAAALPGDLPSPTGAALLGFCRSLRHEAPHQRWQLIDSDGGPGLEDALTHPAPELALRVGALLAPRLEPWSCEPGDPVGELPFGGAALVVCTGGADTRRAMLWLVRERGIVELVLLCSSPEGDDELDASLADEGVRVHRVTGYPNDPTTVGAAYATAQAELRWGLLVAEHRGNLPASRQTQGRIEAALSASTGALRALATASPAGCRLLVLSDPSGWLAPAHRAAWAASCAAIEAEVLALRVRGFAITHLCSGPWRGEITQAERRRLWVPVGVSELSGGDELPYLDDLLASANPASVGLLPKSFGVPG